MRIVGGLDLHRSQITFDVLNLDTGEVRTGKVHCPDRARWRRWLAELAQPGDQVELAVEGCTGWRFVAEEIQAAGFGAHLAEPAQTQAARGPKRRAKTDRSDARLLRELLQDGRLPESWIAPAVVLGWRERVRSYRTLLDQRSAWKQRLHAELYQHGVAVPEQHVATDTTRNWLGSTDLVLAPEARERIALAYRMIDATNAEMQPLAARIRAHGRRHPATRALVDAHYGIGPLVATAVWAELGDCRRFAKADAAVRHAGLDVTVYSSAGRRSGGRLARQGPSVLRWALYEAAHHASRATSPDHDYYCQVRARIDAKRATLSVARKLARRCYHTLRSLTDEELFAHT
jgi:transposase